MGEVIKRENVLKCSVIFNLTNLQLSTPSRMRHWIILNENSNKVIGQPFNSYLYIMLAILCAFAQWVELAVWAGGWEGVASARAATADA